MSQNTGQQMAKQYHKGQTNNGQTMKQNKSQL
jgi:hypothetical protein